jgi:two-component system CheB/CheR fusion protein
VSAERLERFFIKQDGTYQVSRELRELCIFSSHSFIKDPPFSRLDLISCRNVMIYLGLDLQQKVLPLFHYALRSGGYLFLGPSEHVTSHKELFRTMDKKHRIFQRKESVRRPAVAFPFTALGRAKPPDGKPPETDEKNLPKELERVIVQRYAPACVVVKENGEAVYFSGKISRYLEHPAGSPETNVINMAREGLRIPLRTSLHRAVTSRQRTVQTRVSVQVNGGMSPVDLTVEPLPDFEAANLYMIVLEEVAPGPQQSDVPADAGHEETIRSLEGELRLAQEHAQSAYEELETSNEELQSANEEYQSTNEELETSKEELQSFNEELATVNTELNRKVAELEDARIYSESIVDTVREPLLVLDANLRVKSANQSFYKTFGLAAHETINHLLYDVGHREWNTPELQRLLSEMLPEKKKLEDFRVEHEFSNIGRMTMLLNARHIPQQNGEAPLILLAIEDITARSRAENSLREANQDLKHFAYAASHDLQEPLRMVTSYTQLLAKQFKGKLDPLADQSIAYAVEGAHQMEMLLKGLRDYWAVNEGGKVEENIVADCNHALEEALAYLKGRVQESAAVITHDPLPEVVAEEIPLVLLFKNLIGNALKYSRPGEPPRIHVSCQRTAKDWSFSVRDQGIGIEAPHLEKIFIPFKRLHAAEEYAGSGLGLAICQRIVERYQGRIWADSTFGQGSTFHFAIPLQRTQLTKDLVGDRYDR